MTQPFFKEAVERQRRQPRTPTKQEASKQASRQERNVVVLLKLSKEEQVGEATTCKPQIMIIVVPRSPGERYARIACFFMVVVLDFFLRAFLFSALNKGEEATILRSPQMRIRHFALFLLAKRPFF